MKRQKRTNDTYTYHGKKPRVSAYWDWVEEHGTTEGKNTEPARANPDSLLESDGLWYKSEEEKDQETLQSIEKQKMKEKLSRGLKKLNSFQLSVIELSSKFHNIRTIAKKLGVSKSSLHRELERIREIVGQS